MLWTYLKIACRNCKKHKFLTFINLFGLAFSMSIGLMQLVILQSATDIDTFHPHPDKIFRILTEYQQKNGNHWKLASTPLPLSAALQSDTATIAAAVNIYPALNGTATANDKELTINAAFTEPSFFRVFGFTLTEGNPATALQEPHTMILSQRTASKFFGNNSPIGKVIDVKGKGLFTVTGVISTTPSRSHIDFDAYASSSSIPRSTDWGNIQAAYTYVALKPQASKIALSGYLKGEAQHINNLDRNGHSTFTLQPLNKIRPTSDESISNDFGGGDSWGKLNAQTVISLIILIAACFNYTNLTIARALSRAKESGIRKIVGARRYQLFTQYLIESLLQTLLALAAAWIILSFIIRYAPFNDGYEMVPSSWHYNFTFVMWSIAFAVFTGLLAGTAPAWTLSSFQPLRVLKSLSTARIFGKISVQKTLIVFQYSLSLVIIIFLTAFFRQFTMMSSADPGFKRNNVLVLPLEKINPSIAAAKISMVSGVRSVSPLSIPFTPGFAGLTTKAWTMPKPKDPMALNCVFTDETFIPSMDIRLLAGQNFKHRQDSLKETEIIVNAMAVKGLGLATNDAAIGQTIYTADSQALKIIGVVTNFKYEKAGRPLEPIAFRQQPAICKYLYIQYNGTEKAGFEQRVIAAVQPLAPSLPLDPAWLDETIAQNNSQKATISLLGYLAFTAIGIATLGLLGLVIFTVETRRKETGIRKVMGANSSQIVMTLSGKFIRLILMAGAIALPIGYVMSFLFLQSFVERVGNGFISALTCFLFLLAVALSTIFSQTWRASKDNPVNSLRTE